MTSKQNNSYGLDMCKWSQRNYFQRLPQIVYYRKGNIVKDLEDRQGENTAMSGGRIISQQKTMEEKY